jgi:hypothetical protein
LANDARTQLRRHQHRRRPHRPGRVHRELLRLSYLDHLDQPSIAHRLGLPVDAVKSGVAVAMRQLADALERVHLHAGAEDLLQATSADR